MQQEFETKVLDINVAEIEQKLESIWAKITEDTTLMKRWVFDIQSHSDGKGKRFRLRQKWEKTTLTYKERWGNDIWSTQELEVKVSDFETMAKILQKLPWETTAYQENKRKVYMLDDIEFCIDSRPKIPTYLEIESTDIEKVKKWLEILWLTGKDEGDIGVIETYAKYGINLHSYKILKFDE